MQPADNIACKLQNTRQVKNNCFKSVFKQVDIVFIYFNDQCLYKKLFVLLRYVSNNPI